MQAREDNCCFLQIERDDFRRILLSVESMTMRFVEHGRDVLHLEKSNLGRYAVVKGTPEKMLDHLLESEISQRKGQLGIHWLIPFYARPTRPQGKAWERGWEFFGAGQDSPPTLCTLRHICS